MKKRILSALLILALSFSVMAGCSETVPDASPVPEASARQEEVLAPEELPAEEPETSEIPPAPVPESEELPPAPPAVNAPPSPVPPAFDLSAVPVFSGAPYIIVHENQPYFTAEELRQTASFEQYAPLDRLGRCGTAVACIGIDLMPTEERGSIGQVKPTAWHTIKYDHVDGKYLYNRCHLIGYQLTAENANTSNLITGTRYLNIEGMLPFENMTADYIKETGNHVLYRVTPMFERENLLAAGVLMEGWSVEDNGDGICFNVFCYNAQPGVKIDYATGDSGSAAPAPQTEPKPAPAPTPSPVPVPQPVGTDYVLNTSSRKFHYPSCSSVDRMKESNKENYTGSREDLLAQGYAPCGRCHP